MKKLILSSILLCFVLIHANAQNIRLNLYSAYVFPNKFDSYYDATSYYNGRIEDGYQWGAGLEFMANPAYGIEAVYYREDTHAPTTYYYNGLKSSDLDLGINYIMLGGVRYFKKPGGMVEGFGGLMAGLAVPSITNPETNYNIAPAKFGWGVRGGANIWASEKVAIKLQLQLLSVVQSIGGAFFVGTGGAGGGVAAYSTFYQFGMGGGLTFAIGSKSN